MQIVTSVLQASQGRHHEYHFTHPIAQADAEWRAAAYEQFARDDAPADAIFRSPTPDSRLLN